MESIASCTGFISSRTQPLFRRFFSWFGSQLYHHYRWFLLSGILLTIVSASAGALYYSLECDDGCTENRIDYLWIPRSSIVWSQFTEVIDLFGSYPSFMVLLLRSVDRDESILIPSNLDIAYDVFQTVENITLNYKDTHYVYNDLCFRSHPLSPFCDSTFGNFFGFFFNENELLWMNDTNVQQTVNTPNAPAAFFLGGFDIEDDMIIGAESMRFNYELIGSINKTTQDIVYEFTGEWQNYWHQHYDDYKEDIEIAFYTSRSFDDEIDRVVSGDMHIFGFALGTMLIYLMLTLGKISCIGARPWLALSAIFVMICALLMGFSISLCCGATFNTIVVLVPYILLGVGVDDMIILVDSYDHTPMPDNDILKAHQRLGNALAVSGLSISLTSFCSSMAFFVGSATDIPGISSFCMYAAWSFLANYFLQFLIFVPLMVIDDNRRRKRKNFCCPCFIVHDKRLNDKSQINFYDPERTPQDKKWICNANYLMQVTLIPCLSKRICRYITILIFMATFCGSIYVLPLIVTDSDATKLIPDDSYILRFMDQSNEIYSGNSVDELQIILKDLDFSDQNVRNTINAMMLDMESQKDALGSTSNWMNEFNEWLQLNHVTDIDELSSTDFYAKLQTFADETNPWHSLIIYDDKTSPAAIKATRFELKIIKSQNVIDNWPEYKLWNAVVQDHLHEISAQSYAFIPQYSFAYLSHSIVGFTIDNMILAGCGVCGILLLLFDLRLTLFIACIVCMIDIHLFGWMWLMNISLDTLSYAQCVMAVGLTVDYVIHIIHAIKDIEDHKTFEQKLSIALSTMGASVCKGAFTTFLGAFALLFSKSAAFRIFFYMFSGIISIAVAHGMILTPAVLGELWFIYLDEIPPNKRRAKDDIQGIVTNLTIAHAHGAQAGNNISRSDFDEIYPEKAKKSTPIPDTPIDGEKNTKKKKSVTNNNTKVNKTAALSVVQMSNYKDESDESSGDQFHD